VLRIRQYTVLSSGSGALNPFQCRLLVCRAHGSGLCRRQGERVMLHLHSLVDSVSFRLGAQHPVFNAAAGQIHTTGHERGHHGEAVQSLLLAASDISSHAEF
jgi:hypothetical protein